MGMLSLMYEQTSIYVGKQIQTLLIYVYTNLGRNFFFSAISKSKQNNSTR